MRSVGNRQSMAKGGSPNGRRINGLIQNPGTGTFPDIRGPAAAPIAEENGPENAARIIAMVSSLDVT